VEQRIAWDDLPELKQAIESRTGRITGVRMASAGAACLQRRAGAFGPPP